MSIIAAALKHMLAAGMDHEAIVAAVADMEANAPKDAQAERRRQADKERKRLRKSAESAEQQESPSPKKETSPTPPKEKTTPSLETANAVPNRKRATRLPSDWLLPKAWGDEAVAEGLTVEEVRSQAETMRDWSLSAPNGAKLDWHAAWRIWFRKALKDRPVPRGSPLNKPSSSSALADSAARLVQSMRSTDEIRSGSSGPRIPALIPHLPVR